MRHHPAPPASPSPAAPIERRGSPHHREFRGALAEQELAAPRWSSGGAALMLIGPAVAPGETVSKRIFLEKTKKPRPGGTVSAAAPRSRTESFFPFSEEKRVLPYSITHPPSTDNGIPVIVFAPSEHKNTAAAPICSGVEN